MTTGDGPGSAARGATGDAVGSPAALDATLAEHFVELADALFAASTQGVLPVVDCVVRAAGALVSGADVVSVVLREPDGRLVTVSADGDVAEAADRMQDELGEGPSIGATDHHGVGMAVVDDLERTVEWPTFSTRAVAELGLRAVLSTGMFPGGDPPRFGALTFYSRSAEAFDVDARDHALILAAHAATAISAVQARTAGELREAQLAEALRSRDVIGQAKGILMERRGQSADEAFAVLQRASQDLNIKLRDVAQTLVAHRHEI